MAADLHAGEAELQDAALELPTRRLRILQRQRPEADEAIRLRGDDGALLLRGEDGVQRVLAGDVSLRPLMDGPR